MVPHSLIAPLCECQGAVMDRWLRWTTNPTFPDNAIQDAYQEYERCFIEFEKQKERSEKCHASFQVPGFYKHIAHVQG